MDIKHAYKNLKRTHKIILWVITGTITLLTLISLLRDNWDFFQSMIQQLTTNPNKEQVGS